MRYAADTSVSVERSKAEIERTLVRYGAAQFASGWDSTGRAMLSFKIEDRIVQMTLQLPSPDDPCFHKTPGGRRHRKPAAAQAAWEQACRAQWRALALVVKAKLEAVAAGISTLEQEFLAHILLPSGETVGRWMAPQIQRTYQTWKMPALLPAPKE